MTAQSRILPPLLLGLLLSSLSACEPSKVLDPTDTGKSTDDSVEDSEPTDVCDDHPDEVICVGNVAVTCDALGDIDSSEECSSSTEICSPEAGCTSCTPNVAVSFTSETTEEKPGSFIEKTSFTVDTSSFAYQRLGMRPLTISIEDGLREGYVELTGEGSGFEFYREDGAPFSLPATLKVKELPLTLYARALDLESYQLVATYGGSAESCPSPTDSALLQGIPQAELAGLPRTNFPYFEYADSFNDDMSVYATLDPGWHPDRVGLPFDLCVTEHRSPEEWGADPLIVDIAGDCLPQVLGGSSVSENARELLEAPLDYGDFISKGYDVIMDFGRDGRLDPGDIMDGPLSENPGFHVIKDLSTDGPHGVTTLEYSASRWLTQRIYHPLDISTMGALPLVIISHGNGHDYTWYDYLGEHLASHGYVVMSHTNNTGPGIATAAETTLANTDTFLTDLASIGDGSLLGHVDADTIVWIGHSRGGEGVVYAYNALITGAYSPEAYGPEDIRLIVSIAPTVFYSVDTSNPHEAPYFLISGTADGDVTGGPDCPQCDFFRIHQAAQGPAWSAYVQGADHNDFNCCGFEDAAGPSLIGRDEAQIVARSYFLALIQSEVEGNIATREYMTRSFASFRPSGVGDDTILTLQCRDPEAERAAVIEDYETNSDSSLSSSSGLVSYDVSNIYEGRADDADSSMGWRDTDPMNGMTEVYNTLDTSQVTTFSWDEGATASYELEVVDHLADFSDYTFLSFRACQVSRSPEVVALAETLDFTVALVDSTGLEVGLNFGDLSPLVEPYARTGLGSGSGWANEWSSVRLRLSDFQAEGTGLDLREITHVRFLFGEGYGSVQGRIGLDDLEVLP